MNTEVFKKVSATKDIRFLSVTVHLTPFIFDPK